MRVLVACEEPQEVSSDSVDASLDSCSDCIEWKEIPGFQDYEVNNIGEVRSKDRLMQYPNRRKILFKSKILSPTLSSGYKSVNLRRDSKSYSKKVHCLVAECFLGKRPPRADVRHKNGDKLDNRVENLEYGSRSDNNLDQYRIRGYVTKLQKLSPYMAKEIVRRVKRGESQRSLAKEYNVCKSTINAIFRGDLYGWCTNEERCDDSDSV